MGKDVRPHLDRERESCADATCPAGIVTAPVETEHNDAIELLRVVAACGVIWFHMETAPGRSFGLAGLIFFLTVGVIFQKRSAERDSVQRYFRKRAARLLLPWAAWFVIYGLLNLAVGKRLFPQSSGFVANLVTGPWIGLWYLPFSFVSACIVYCGVKFLGRISSPVQFGGCMLASILALILVSKIRVSTSMVAPWAQFLQAGPSIPIGFALVAASVHLPNSCWMLLLLQSGLLLTCGGLYKTDPGLAISYGLGTLLVSVGVAFERRLTWPIGAVSSLCLGVYLIHGAVLSGFKLFPWVADRHLLWFVLTVFCSFMGVVLMRRVPYLARIV